MLKMDKKQTAKKSTAKKGNAKKKNVSPSGKKLQSRSTVKSSSNSNRSTPREKYPSKELRLILFAVASLILVVSYYFKDGFGIVGNFLRVTGAFFLGSMYFTIPVIFVVYTISVLIMLMSIESSPFKIRSLSFNIFVIH